MPKQTIIISNDEKDNDTSDDELPLEIDVPLSIPTQGPAKSKRSSSTSNDMIHERDRFRARFHSFNTSESGDIDEQGEQDDCEVCARILTKTTKLNLSHTSLVSSSGVSTDSMIDLLGMYSIKESTSPLDRASSYFRRHLPPIPDSKVDSPLELRNICVPQLSAVFDWYFNRPLPSTNQMFPWLHGLHQDNFAQRSFFISQQLTQNARSDKHDLTVDVTKPNSARFLMCVNTCSTSTFENGKVLRNTVAPTDILRRIEYSRSEVSAQVKKLVRRCFPGQPSDKIASIAEIIAEDCFETAHMPTFLNLDPQRGVSLRNFHIQVAKLARCSDFVVYCSQNTHYSTCKCTAFGRLLKLAQIAEDISTSPRYNVFILNTDGVDIDTAYSDVLTVGDNSSIILGLDASKKTQLISNSMRLLKTDTFSAWDADYQVKEKVETTRMSAATKLLLNVWLGNIWDHLAMLHYLKQDYIVSDFDFKISPLSINKDVYCNPETSSLTNRNPSSPDSSILLMLPQPRAHWQLFVQCHNDASFPSLNVLGDLLFKYTISPRNAAEVDNFHMLEFPSSGSVGFGDCKQENLTSIVNLCKLLYLYSSSVAEGSLASLIYCSDGYTELSLLIFCFLIYAENITLEDAILKLHLEYGRPFYIFNSDVIVLRKLERFLRKFSPLALGSKIKWSQLETTTAQEINEAFLGPSKVTDGNIPNKLRLGYIANDSDSESSDSEGDRDDINDTSSYLNSSWVENVEGSLPSRILPYLYLGSLKHANNLTLLSKLGIKKVISVGEKLDWLNGYKFQHNNDIFMEEIDEGNIEIYNIVPKPSSFTKNPVKCTVESVMKVNNLQDDGIDELTRSLPRILDYIDEEHRKNDGETRILVHCRVGVSRSATVVIAEVMRRLQFNLPQAYLYVRVRRLNIVIQPNLRFMYELFKWEEQERSKQKSGDNQPLREIDWFVMCQEIKKLNMPYFNS